MSYKPQVFVDRETREQFLLSVYPNETTGEIQVTLARRMNENDTWSPNLYPVPGPAPLFAVNDYTVTIRESDST